MNIEAKSRPVVLFTLCASALIAACGGTGAPAGDEEAVVPDVSGTELSSSCSGVVPTSTAGFDWVTQAPGTGDCLGGTSDGSGAYFAGLYDDFDQYADYWYLVPGGGGFGTPSAAIVDQPTLLQPDALTQRLIFPQQSGAMILEPSMICDVVHPGHCVDHASVKAYSHAGVLTRETVLIDLATPQHFPDQAWSGVNDRAGGLMATHASLPGDGTWHLYTQRFNANGGGKAGLKQLAGSTALSTAPQRTMSGISTQGYGLVAWDNGAQLRAIWTDASGNPHGGTLALPGRWTSGEKAGLFQLLDGSMAVQVNGAWIARVPSLAQATTAVPSWLATRPNSQLYVVRGGRAYAVMFAPQGTAPLQLALFAPAGNRCGGLSLPQPAGGSGIQSDLGRDGTVILTANGGPEVGIADTCRYRFYPGLLR